jgi:hypothetical protein
MDLLITITFLSVAGWKIVATHGGCTGHPAHFGGVIWLIFTVAWALLALAKSENSDSAKLVDRTRTAHFISGMHNYPG